MKEHDVVGSFPSVSLKTNSKAKSYYHHLVGDSPSCSASWYLLVSKYKETSLAWRTEEEQ